MTTNEIKTLHNKLLAEYKRRNKPNSTNHDLENFATSIGFTDYDIEYAASGAPTKPAAEGKVLAAQANKIIERLLYINEDPNFFIKKANNSPDAEPYKTYYTTFGDPIQNQFNYTELNAYIDKLANYPAHGNSTTPIPASGCNGACVGLCTDQCVGRCAATTYSATTVLGHTVSMNSGNIDIDKLNNLLVKFDNDETIDQDTKNSTIAKITEIVSLMSAEEFNQLCAISNDEVVNQINGICWGCGSSCSGDCSAVCGGGCNGDCNGGCTAKCNSGCGACDVTCGNACKNACNSGCAGCGTCTGYCGGCQAYCDAGCAGTCNTECNGCQSGCESCTQTCAGYCNGGCKSCNGCGGGCSKQCTWCSTSCSDGCGGCGDCGGCGGCGGCGDTCNDGCSSCSNTCTSGCDDSCTSSCWGNCSTGCLNTCKSNCQYACAATCGNSCSGTCISSSNA